MLAPNWEISEKNILFFIILIIKFFIILIKKSIILLNNYLQKLDFQTSDFSWLFAYIYMIFSKFPNVNIPKLNVLLVICIAKDFIWTALKEIISIFRFFCTLRFQIFK